MAKIRVGVIFGGKSAEHEVSLQSARNIVEAIDKEKYEVVLIGMDKEGRWYLNEGSEYLLNTTDSRLIQLNKSNQEVALVPGERANQLISLADKRPLEQLDVIFPALHGPYGEDGTVQGLLKLANIPFVGAGVLGSAVGMDKDVMKRLLRDAGIRVAKFLVYRSSSPVDYDQVRDELGMPVFVKPANLGSSVGINKVKTRVDFARAVSEALQFDNKIIVEENIIGREVECAVLGNEDPAASLPGEILPSHEFYSYEAKYIDENGAALAIPAELPAELTAAVQDTAVRVFKVLCCEGMARVDLFIRKDDSIVVNEINTIPGFTRISMYPKLWEASGISYSRLIDRLIELALERYRNEQMLKTTYNL